MSNKQGLKQVKAREKIRKEGDGRKKES